MRIQSKLHSRAVRQNKFTSAMPPVIHFYALYMITVHEGSLTINFTCAKVMETFSFFFLEAKIKEDTSSEAFEHSGVTTNDT